MSVFSRSGWWVAACSLTLACSGDKKSDTECDGMQCAGAGGGAATSTGGALTSGGVAADTGGSGGKLAGGVGGASGGVGGRTVAAGGASTGPTPVSLHGKLAVVGANLVDSSGAQVKLEGMSSMWLNWEPTGYALSKAGLEWMRDNWNLRVFRVAMGVAPETEPNGAYLGNPAKHKQQVNQIVQNAIDAGVYVIIDWHDHEALAHRAEAEAFFREMSMKWGGYPNVLYEVFNEPLALSWASELKPYHQALVAAIRENDPDNVIILGTPNWDQDVDVAAASPVTGSNLMYTLHFYACTHQATMRNKAQLARSRGLPMFVTEWGATDADGGVDGLVCEAEARTWHDFLDANLISWTAWKLDGCSDSSCMFKDRAAPVDGGWTAAMLNGHAPIVIDEMTNGPDSGGATGSGGAGSGGAGGASSTGGKTSGGASSSGGTTSVESVPTEPGRLRLDLIVQHLLQHDRRVRAEHAVRRHHRPRRQVVQRNRHQRRGAVSVRDVR
ncbi:MAG: glycoside hydrolase family 5 protein [Polyangiaceae bacterium]